MNVATVIPITAIASPRRATKLVWAGRVISASCALFMAFDGAIKLANIEPVRAAFEQLGYPIAIAPGIGLLALVCTAFYVVPRTAVFGAILLTAYLGGAVASHVRVDTSYAFTVGVGILVWLGIYLRDAKLRALVPLR